jgi:hypothetical protein
MATEFATESAAPVSTLVSGIVEDAKLLLVEQLTLFQVEIKNDMNRTLRAVIPLVAGAVILIPTVLLAGMAASYGLCAVVPDLPTWAGFAIVAGAGGIVGLALVLWGALSFGSLTPDTALKGLKENLQWKTKK